MAEDYTVLVLGAGASKEYKFPLGRELLMDVCDALRSDDSDCAKTLYQALGPDTSEDNRYGLFSLQVQSFRHDLLNSHLPSVDAFVRIRQNDEYDLLARYAIAHVLVKKEVPEELERSRDERWYEVLFRHLETSPEGIESPLKIVTFNYDRSLEKFLLDSLQASHGITEEQAHTCLKGLGVAHVYGSLGGHLFSGRDYSPDASWESVKVAAKSIRLLGEERREGSSELQQAHEYFTQAKRVAFIGFAYDETNVGELKLESCLPRGVDVLGTGFGLSVQETRRVKTLFSRICNKAAGIQLHDEKASEFMVNTAALSF